MLLQFMLLQWYKETRSREFMIISLISLGHPFHKVWKRLVDVSISALVEWRGLVYVKLKVLLLGDPSACGMKF